MLHTGQHRCFDEVACAEIGRKNALPCLDVSMICHVETVAVANCCITQLNSTMTAILDQAHLLTPIINR